MIPALLLVVAVVIWIGVPIAMWINWGPTAGLLFGVLSVISAWLCIKDDHVE